MKKFVSVTAVLVLLFQSAVFALTDEFIFTDAVSGEFSGRAEAVSIIENLQFTDMPGHGAYEAVARAGALNIVKGNDDAYIPSGSVSNAEMISAVIRAAGRENDAVNLAARLAPTLPPDSDLRKEMKIGYLSLANQLGMITGAQFANVLAADQSVLDPAIAFVYDAPVSRQQAAAWLHAGLLSMNQNAFAQVNTGSVQKTYNFKDWNQVSALSLTAVERLTALGSLTGDAGNNLRPNAPLTKSELVYMFKNLDDLYYGLIGAQKRNGTVGGLKESAAAATGSANYAAAAYIRNSDGRVDVIKNYLEMSQSKPLQILEIPVYKNGETGGIYLLEEGDEIEYLVRPGDDTALYIEVTQPRPVVTEYVTGKLQSIDSAAGKITLKDENGLESTYTMIQGLYFTENGKDYVYMDYNKKQETVNIPTGSTLNLRLKNGICDEIYYIGEPNTEDEFRGIVIENNTDLGYLVVIDNLGKRIVKNFYPEDIRVKKREYYQMDDDIGYISDVFPHFKYNPLDSDIYGIEPGDIVFIRNDPQDPDFIRSISASTNYIARYGKILQFNHNGDYYEMLLEYENKQTAWFDVSEQLFITKDGKPVTADKTVPGDWARVLVNQAVISPGFVLEAAKEIVLEAQGHLISEILRGQLSGINAVQNQLLVQNVQTLTNTGWSNYKQTANFNLSGRDIEYFHDGRKISLDYAVKYFKRSDNEVYIALENNYAGDKVRKVTFRSGQDQLLNPDTVISSDGNGGFATGASSGKISTDAGTIVRRHGRLVSGVNIASPDFAAVALNGGANAAVVDITDAPDNSRLTLGWGMVISVNEGKSFEVQLTHLLNGNSWQRAVTMIRNRNFAIDYNTTLVNSGGITNIDRLVNYNSAVDDTLTTSVNKFFNILIDGTRAARVIESPFCPRSVRGTVYSVDAAGNKIYLKDASYLSANGTWTPVGNANATLEITAHPNTFIGKNNQAVGLNSINTGNQLRIMTDTLPARVLPASVVNGYLIFVEN